MPLFYGFVFTVELIIQNKSKSFKIYFYLNENNTICQPHIKNLKT